MIVDASLVIDAVAGAQINCEIVTVDPAEGTTPNPPSPTCHQRATGRQSQLIIPSWEPDTLDGHAGEMEPRTWPRRLRGRG